MIGRGAIVDTPLVTTKLEVPRLRADRIPRPLLLDRLNAGLTRPVTLVSAPAGFGKTSVVAEWVSNCGRPVAWLSLDERDSDPGRFMAYLVAALRQVEDEAGGRTLAMMAAAGPQASLAPIMPHLVDEINVIPEPFVLVLDDYHLISEPTIHTAVGFLIEHMPQPLHLVLASRADPPVPLARMRAQGQLTEIRQSDLRFTTEETGALLRGVSGVELTSRHVGMLEKRTEGWVAGLQLARLALQDLSTSADGARRAAEFIESFGGTQRHVVDYLMEEVLLRQTAEVTDFLLNTSILDRMCGPLCDAVMGFGGLQAGSGNLAGATVRQSRGQQLLEALERANLFIEPLDDKREWYRYHQLMADMLEHRLRQGGLSNVQNEPRTDVASLHRRASAWYASRGLLPDAVRHALEAQDFESAAEMIESAVPDLWKRGEVATLLQWMEALPEETLRAHPRACAYSAVILHLRSTSFALVERRLQLAEESDLEGCVRGEIALLHAMQEMFRGETAGGLVWARRAFEQIPQGSILRGLALRVLSGLCLLAGDMKAAQDLLERDLAVSQSVGDRLGLSASLRRLGSMAMYSGELRRAQALYERALDLSRDPDGHLWPTAGRVLTHLAEVALERNDLDKAEEHIQQALELLERFMPGWDAGAYAVLAHVRLAQGDQEGAQEALEVAWHRARGTETRLDDVYLEVQAARLDIWRGDLASAERRASDCAVAPPARPRGQDIDGLVGSRLFQEMLQTTRVRLHLARRRPEEAFQVLQELQEAAAGDAGGGGRIETLMLRALANSARGRIEAGLDDLGRAFELAEPEGFFRTFVDEGEPMRRLLREALRRGVGGAYAARLLEALDAPSARNLTAATRLKPRASRPEVLVEPLTEREVEVLRLLQTSLTTPEIAGELGIAPSTVRTFVKNVYGKLGVHRRLDAIDRAVELGLLRS
jgi:LuxR family maltose regulon positive regulatory protein